MIANYHQNILSLIDLTRSWEFCYFHNVASHLIACVKFKIIRMKLIHSPKKYGPGKSIVQTHRKVNKLQAHMELMCPQKSTRTPSIERRPKLNKYWSLFCFQYFVCPNHFSNDVLTSGPSCRLSSRMSSPLSAYYRLTFFLFAHRNSFLFHYQAEHVKYRSTTFPHVDRVILATTVRGTEKVTVRIRSLTPTEIPFPFLSVQLRSFIPARGDALANYLPDFAYPLSVIIMSISFEYRVVFKTFCSGTPRADDAFPFRLIIHIYRSIWCFSAACERSKILKNPSKYHLADSDLQTFWQWKLKFTFPVNHVLCTVY